MSLTTTGRRRFRGASGAALVLAAVLLVAAPASADTVNGERQCTAGRTVTTSTQTGSGWIHHHQQSFVKSWNNSGVTWRHWNKALNYAWYIFDAPGGPLLTFGTACVT